MGCNEMKDKKREPPNKNNNLNQSKTKENLNSDIPQENDNNLQKEKMENNVIGDQNPQLAKQLSEPYKNSDMENQNIKIEEQDIKEDEKDNLEKENLRNKKNNLDFNDTNSSKSGNSNNEENIVYNLLIDREDYIPDFIGKLCFEPLLLFVYECKKNTFQVKKFDHSQINLEELNSSSSYCNGDNKLFVSGGVDNNENILDKLWIFDLTDYNIDNSIQISPKKNHSMIYIPRNYIFFVGGSDEKVFYLDINEKKIENWESLNKKRIEPALIQMNNFLYVFDNVNKEEDNNNFELSFERTNILNPKSNWELIKPRLSGEILDTNIVPKYFGVAKESDNSIIFLGGNLLDEQDNMDAKYYKYSIKDNIIEFSNVPFVNVRLNEKSFLSFNNKNNIYLILPDFHKKCPQVVFYIKNKNQLKVIDYMPNAKNEENRIIHNDNKRIIKESNLFKKYNFNMPKNSGKINEIIEI